MINPLKPGKKRYHPPNIYTTQTCPNNPATSDFLFTHVSVTRTPLLPRLLFQGFNIVEHVHIKEDTLESEYGQCCDENHITHLDHPTIRCLHAFINVHINTCLHIYTHCFIYQFLLFMYTCMCIYIIISIFMTFKASMHKSLDRLVKTH